MSDQRKPDNGATRIYLVRHARAGRRGGRGGDDDLRPLSKVGRRQAEALVEMLAREQVRIERIVSSPIVRCRQTVAPLAEALGLPVELSQELAEGAPVTDGLRLLEKVADANSVLCTHGDVISELLKHLRRTNGLRLRKHQLDTRAIEKGSAWRLMMADGAVSAAHYLPPEGPRRPRKDRASDR